jgi:hypothetical protein
MLLASIKVVVTSMFFSTKISHVAEELRQRKELREFVGVRFQVRAMSTPSFLNSN